MTNKRKQSGFVLLVAVTMIPLVAVGIWIITQHSRYLIRETLYQTLRAEARNAACSAGAWADLHRARILASPPEQTWTPDLSQLQPPRAACRVKIISQTPSGCTLEITAVARSGDKSWTEKRTLTLFR